MELLSRFKKKQSLEDASDDDFRTKAERETEHSGVKLKSKSNSKRQAIDPLLPEKKRARRRLIGALALGIGAIVFLPMIFDSEPKFSVRDAEVMLPAKDKVQDDKNSELENGKKVSQSSVEPNNQPKSSSELAKEEIVDPKSLGISTEAKSASKTATENSEQRSTKVSSESNAAGDSKISNSNKQVKPTMLDEGHNSKIESTSNKSRTKDEETTRALAILEGKIAPTNKTTNELKSPSKKFTVQVAALATQDKVDELRQKLKVAGLDSTTSKVNTPKGDVIRVRLGPFPSKEEADRVTNKLKHIGLSGTIIPN